MDVLVRSGQAPPLTFPLVADILRQETRKGFQGGLRQSWEREMHLLYYLLIGLIAGWLAGQIMKGKGFGLLGDLVVGIVGAFLGGFVFSFLGLSATGLIGELVTALVGAIILLYVVKLIK